MKPNSMALAASLLSSVLLWSAVGERPNDSPPSATATRPATTPPGQTSIPNEARRPRQPRPPAKPVAIPS